MTKVEEALAEVVAEEVEAVEEVVAAFSFELDDTQIEEIKPKSGRPTVHSKYQADVAKAILTGKTLGVPIPADRKAPALVAELHKEAKRQGRKLRTWTKLDAKTPYVAFRVREEEKAEEAKADSK